MGYFRQLEIDYFAYLNGGDLFLYTFIMCNPTNDGLKEL